MHLGSVHPPASAPEQDTGCQPFAESAVTHVLHYSEGLSRANPMEPHYRVNVTDKLCIMKAEHQFQNVRFGGVQRKRLIAKIKNICSVLEYLLEKNAWQFIKTKLQ